MNENNAIVKGEIVDERTGEIIPAGASNQVKELAFTSAPSFESVGTLELDDKAQQALGEALNPADVKIRPDGNVYLPWTWYASRLNRAFGIARWGLIPQGMPMSKPHGQYGDVLIAWGHWLVVNGKPIGFAIGETTYKPNNAMMSYADACEGAKSNSLARNCKLLGMSLDLWDADFCEDWRNMNAEQYTDKDSKKKWRKRTQPKQQLTKTVTTPATVSPEQPHPENINQETGEVADAVEIISPMTSWAVEYAAKKWNCATGEAAPRIAALKLGSKIEKADFVKIIDES